MAAGSPCPTCQKIHCNCVLISNCTIGSVTNPTLHYTTESNILQINNRNNECIFKIDSDGNLYFGKNMMILDLENELALGFIMVISEVTGISFTSNKDEFISKMIQYYRERQLNKII